MAAQPKVRNTAHSFTNGNGPVIWLFRKAGAHLELKNPAVPEVAEGSRAVGIGAVGSHEARCSSICISQRKTLENRVKSVESVR